MLAGRCFLGFLLRLGFDGNTAVAGVATDRVDDLGHHLLEFVKELRSIVLTTFDFTQLLLPNTRQLSTLEQFFVNKADEFDACRRGNQAFAFLANVLSFEESFDDGCAG